jgi:hypothetical protein
MVFYSANSSLDKAVKYQVELNIGGFEYALQENTPIRFRQGEGSE